MAEAHQPLVAGLHSLDEGGDPVFRLDPAEHPQHRLVGAAVERAVEGADAGGDRRVRVDAGGADHPHRAGRAVLLVVGVEDEEHVERPLEPRVGLVLELGHLVEHRQEVAGVGEVVVRVDVRLAARVAEGEGGERRHLGDQADGLDRAALRVVDVLGVRVEGRKRPDRPEKHPHRVGVVAEALHEALDVLVDEGVDRDQVGPLGELVGGGKLAVDQQVGDLQVAGVLGQLLDRVAPVLEDSLVAVDEGDRRPARGGVHVGRVVRHQAEVALVLLDLAELEAADRPVGYREPVLGAGALVGYLQAFVTHWDLPSEVSSRRPILRRGRVRAKGGRRRSALAPGAPEAAALRVGGELGAAGGVAFGERCGRCAVERQRHGAFGHAGDLGRVDEALAVPSLDY